jgi:DNA replication protein DnaC
MTRTVSTQLKTIAFSDSIQQLTNSFTGRTWVLNKIDHWLQQKDQRFLVIAGEPGVGKSAIAAILLFAKQKNIPKLVTHDQLQLTLLLWGD